ncbi:MAG: N-acetyl-gamma-glutamyl-phosphate reductase [Anaerolineae bacterium]|nr:N-acetyl-gamma-glutamyl-phosphate reductase [Anaerolineae bacterium]
MTIRVGVYGATGYTGLELIAILARHPEVELRFATSENSAGTSLRQSHPAAPDIPLVTSDEAPLGEVDAVFLCLPHTASAKKAAEALAQGVRVIDLSADLRLKTAADYEHWYKTPHAAPEILPVPYGLPELGREALRGAKAIANPGCYPTATLLGLVPLARKGLILPGTPIIVDAKSGVSGAGRTAKQYLLFAEITGNFYPYSIGRVHRHLSEMEQTLAEEGIEKGRLIFSPHLLPVDRGILNTMYVQVSDIPAAQQAIRDAYAGEPLVAALPGGEMATLAHVVRTPRAAISTTPGAGSTLIIVSVIDNLLKGASSQAVQNFNLMWNLPETSGLL